MDFLFIACIVLIALIAVCFACYVKITGEIIKSQEREIESLVKEADKLKIDNDYLQKSRDQFKRFVEAYDNVKARVIIKTKDGHITEALKNNNYFEDF